VDGETAGLGSILRCKHFKITTKH